MPEANDGRRTGDGRDRVATRWVQARPESAATIRHELAHELGAAGVSERLIEDATLVASELVGNAIRHADALAGQLVVTWERRADGITIRVTDGGSRKYPRVRNAGPTDSHGRGLSIVAALADSWGVTPGPGTVTVWAHLPESSPVPA